jgi:cobalamin synthase
MAAEAPKEDRWVPRVLMIYNLCRWAGMTHSDAIADVAEGLGVTKAEVRAGLAAGRPKPVVNRRHGM